MDVFSSENPFSQYGITESTFLKTKKPEDISTERYVCICVCECMLWTGNMVASCLEPKQFTLYLAEGEYRCKAAVRRNLDGIVEKKSGYSIFPVSVPCKEVHL